jgi:hypothetical protein
MGEATQVALACTCSEIRERDKLHMCIACHIYWINDKQLTSVSRILKDCFPATYDGVAPEVLENARDRGVQLDALISAYVVGKLTEFPVGTRHDVIDLFEKFQGWWDRQGFKTIEAQVVVHDSEVAGTIDLRADGFKFDVKCTYDLLYTHHIQIGGYSQLDENPTGAIIHITKRLKAPRIIETPTQAYEDWMTTRDFWKLKRRMHWKAGLSENGLD